MFHVQPNVSQGIRILTARHLVILAGNDKYHTAVCQFVMQPLSGYIFFCCLLIKMTYNTLVVKKFQVNGQTIGAVKFSKIFLWLR